MSESKILQPWKTKKLKNLKNLQENVIHDYVIIICKYSCWNLIGWKVL